MAEKRLSGSACPRRSPVGDIRNVLGSGTHSALIEIAPRRLFNDGERCVCSRRYYFLAAMLPFAWWSGTCPWAVSRAVRREMETDMNIFGSRGGNETPEFGPRDGAPAFSEIGAVLAAGVVLGLAFLILS